MLIPCSWLLVCCVFVSSFLFATSECFRDFAKQDNSYIYVTCGLFLKSSFMIYVFDFYDLIESVNLLDNTDFICSQISRMSGVAIDMNLYRI